MSTIGRLDTLKNTEIIRENAFEQKKKKLGLQFNLGLELISWVFAGLKKFLVQYSRTHLCPGLNSSTLFLKKEKLDKFVK